MWYGVGVHLYFVGLLFCFFIIHSEKSLTTRHHHLHSCIEIIKQNIEELTIQKTFQQYCLDRSYFLSSGVCSLCKSSFKRSILHKNIIDYNNFLRSAIPWLKYMYFRNSPVSWAGKNAPSIAKRKHGPGINFTLPVFLMFKRRYHVCLHLKWKTYFCSQWNTRVATKQFIPAVEFTRKHKKTASARARDSSYARLYHGCAKQFR